MDRIFFYKNLCIGRHVLISLELEKIKIGEN